MRDAKGQTKRGGNGAMAGSAQAMEQFRDYAQQQSTRILTPVARLLMRLKITANQVSLTGLALNVVAGALIVGDHLIWAGILVLVSGTLDLLDGLVARLSETANNLGAFLDSTVDRISEGVIFAAIAYRFALEGAAVDASLIVLALLGSVLVSYTRARAEGLGVECKVGLVTRAERVVLIAAGLLSAQLPIAIYILIALSFATVWQRLVHTARALGESDRLTR